MKDTIDRHTRPQAGSSAGDAVGLQVRPDASQSTPQPCCVESRAPYTSEIVSFFAPRARVLACLLALLAGLLPGATLFAAPAPQFGNAGATATPWEEEAWEEEAAHCAELQPEAVRDELNRISQGIFAEGETAIDLDAIVARQWRALHLDATLDRAVADAVNQVRTSRDWTTRISSAWVPSSAQSLTEEVATLAFGSETFHQAIDALSEAVAADVAAEFGALSVSSAAQTMLCLQTYIGGRYSQVFVAAFADEIRAGAAQADLGLDEHLDTGLLTILGQHRTALGGVGVIIAGQVAGRIVQRIGQDLARRVAGRIAGRVLGRVGSAAIPVLGWVVGIGMIVYDVAESWDGALPQIQTSLQSTEVKQLIRSEIVLAVEPELRLAAPQVARELANELYAEWLDFQRKYQQVLVLARENADFRALLSDATNSGATDVGHLATLIDVLLNTTGRAELEAALGDGRFQRLMGLPPAAVEILRTSRSIETTLEWANLAGGMLGPVVQLEIYKHKSAQELDRTLLAALVALDERTTVAKLVLLETHDLASLLRLSGPNLAQITARLSPAELAWLARYVDEMSPAQANLLIMHVLQTPELMSRLQHEGVADLLVRTTDPTRTLAFLAVPPSVPAFPNDAWTVLSGQVDGRFFIYKYGWPITLAVTVIGLLIVLAPILRPILGLVRFVSAPFRRRSGPVGN